MLNKALKTMRYPLVSPKELAKMMADKTENLRVVNSTCTRPFEDVDNDHYFNQRRIPGSTFLNIKKVVDTEQDVAGQIPRPKEFRRYMKRLDIRSGDSIVLYDDLHIAGAARMWWVFKTYGINALVLDGGFNSWVEEIGEVEEGIPEYVPRKYVAEDFAFFTFRGDLVYNFENVNCLSYLIETNHEKALELVDARGAARFQALVPEPREGMRSGNIPGSKNVPFNLLLDPETHKMKSNEDIAAQFEEAGVELDKEIVTTCGSGVTASVLQLGLDVIKQGKGRRRVYDGSWSEYGVRDEMTEDQITPLIEEFILDKNL